MTIFPDRPKLPACQPPGSMATTLGEQRYLGIAQKLQLTDQAITAHKLAVAAAAPAHLVTVYPQWIVGF